MAVDICNSPDWCFFGCVFFVQRNKCECKKFIQPIFPQVLICFSSKTPQRLTGHGCSSHDWSLWRLCRGRWTFSVLRSTEHVFIFYNNSKWPQYHCSVTTFNNVVSVTKEGHQLKKCLYAKLRRDISEKVMRFSGENELRFALWNEYLIQSRFQIASAPGIGLRLVALIGFGKWKQIESELFLIYIKIKVCPRHSDFLLHPLT